MSSLVACDGRPQREKFPGPPGRTTEIAQAQAQQAVMGGGVPQAPVESSQIPTHVAPGDGASAVATSQKISGRLDLPKGAKPKGSFLFISVRPEAGGPPIAVRRDQNPKFPYEFSLGAADVMMAGTPFEGKVTVTARLKQDSDPLSRKPGDFSAMLATEVGDTKVKLTLQQD